MNRHNNYDNNDICICIGRASTVGFLTYVTPVDTHNQRMLCGTITSSDDIAVPRYRFKNVPARTDTHRHLKQPEATQCEPLTMNIPPGREISSQNRIVSAGRGDDNPTEPEIMRIHHH